MSGRLIRFVAATICLTGLLLASEDAWAFDPLFTEPEVLETGKLLPGDTEVVKCPAHKEFSFPLTLGDAVDLGLCNNPQIK